MDTSKKPKQDQSVDVNFESHPPIEGDLDGITALIRQTFLHFIECQPIARYLIGLKDVTQVIALVDGSEEEEDKTGGDDEDDNEPDNDIYAVTSIVDLHTKSQSKNQTEVEARKQLAKFLKDKCAYIKNLINEDEDKLELKLGFVVNERYINLPPQLSLPTLKNLTQHLDKLQYTHLLFVSKVLLQARNTETKLPSKKVKAEGLSSTKSAAEPIVYVNPEEEIICESCEHFVDLDVSAHCDENATWSSTSDVKYIPHRRIMVVEYKKWLTIMENLEKELV